MSPASQTGGLHVERYIGSCLISNSSRAHASPHKYSPNYGNKIDRRTSPKPPHFVSGPGVYRPGYVSSDGLFRPPPYCQSQSNWAGVPLISTAGRRTKKPQTMNQAPQNPSYHRQPMQPINAGVCGSEFTEGRHLPLSRLALHTQGAPLILSRRYNTRKQNQYQHHNIGQYPASPVCRPQAQQDFAAKKIREANMPKENRFDCKEQVVVSARNNAHLALNMDSLSVTSDESSGSANSETCLPRIIKPRKRRKKDRKPLSGNSQEKAAEDCKPDEDQSTDPSGESVRSYSPVRYDRSDIGLFNCAAGLKSIDFGQSFRDSPGNGDRLEVVKSESRVESERSRDASTCDEPKLHHSFEDVDENESDDSSSLFEAIRLCSPAVCQCRYCDPSGHSIWDIDQHCYSPFLTPPAGKDYSEKNNFPDKDTLLRRSWSEPCSGYSVENLRISEYDRQSTPHRSDTDIHRDRSATPGVGVIGGGRRGIKSLESPEVMLDWKEAELPWHRPVPDALFKSSSSHGVSLEVSSAIVTSLNGHRDLEIKFFSTSPSAVASDRSSFFYPNREQKPCESGVIENVLKCGETSTDLQAAVSVQ